MRLKLNTPQLNFFQWRESLSSLEAQSFEPTLKASRASLALASCLPKSLYSCLFWFSPFDFAPRQKYGLLMLIALFPYEPL